ncbi:unnamed protein product [Lepeophtheirus salmonis]|uniref:(salmon louse) hypothetical protein n=1 Tax=Lepeophtheirus salmonis TaxID=72036 RepID=A0A7R8H5N2_LEPSM|nr:unnamed protein product [Lepeophtheirus salmonis]CAF2883660.1 unnamed protein product [Lepeophtheirus salmonis]
MPFELRSAAQTFQRLIDQVLFGLEFCYVNLEDIIVASYSEEQYEEDLKKLFQRLQQFGLTTNLDKIWENGKMSFTFLRYVIDCNGIKPVMGMVQALLLTQDNNSIPHELTSASYAFIRSQSFNTALDSPYPCMFKVIECTDKTVQISKDGNQETISIDRVKPPFMTLEVIPTANSKTPGKPISSGCRVKFPSRLKD